jgi:hypothetical protein
MKVRWTKKVIFIGLLYLVIFISLALVWDSLWRSRFPVLATSIIGLITILGGFLLAYWLIESDKFAKLSQRKQRIITTLKFVKNRLMPWIYDYANALSGEFAFYSNSSPPGNRIASGQYKNDIPLLEYVFGIHVSDKNGKPIRGNYNDPEDKILRHPIHTQFIYSSLDWGLKELERIDMRIREFPSFLEEIDPDIAKIIHLSDFIRKRITELQDWERRFGEAQNYLIQSVDVFEANLAVRSNLRTVGHTALDTVIAIDANIENLEAD